MRKFISLLLIFSIAGHANVCNMYTMKGTVFKKAREFRKIHLPYYLRAIKHEFSGSSFDKMIVDYISSAYSKDTLNQTEVETFFKKIEKSRYIADDLTDHVSLKDWKESVLKHKTGYSQVEKNILTNLEAKNYSDVISDEIHTFLPDLKKIRHLDALTVSKLFNDIKFQSKLDVEIFFNLILVSDTYSGKSRLYYLDNFEIIYIAIKSGDTSKLNKENFKIYKKFKKIESRSESYRISRERLHGSNERALREQRTFRRIRTMCKTRRLNTLGNQHKKLFKRFSYFATGAAVFYGYHKSGKLYEEEGTDKLIVELVLSLLSMWVGAEATAADGLSNTAKFLIWYIKGFAYNYVDKVTFEKLFEDPDIEATKFEDEHLPKLIESLKRDKGVAEIFDRLDSSVDPRDEIQKILRDKGYLKDDTKIQNDILEVVFEGISEMTNEGSEADHRFDFNNFFTAGWNIVAFGYFLLLYRNFCQGFTMGAHTIGGITKPLQALTIAIGSMILYRYTWQKLYFPNRKNYICRRTKC